MKFDVNFTKMFRYLIQHSYFILGLGIGLLVSLATVNNSNECPFDNEVEQHEDNFRYAFSNSELETSDYEPRILVDVKQQKTVKTPRTLIRPRYYSTELEIREKLFVAILTSDTDAEKNAVAINRTLSHLVNKVLFFIDSSTQNKINSSISNIISLTDSRKNLKVFHVMKYISDNYLEDYDFFFITTDQTYINGRQLVDLVSKISVSEDVSLGIVKDLSSHCSLDSGLLLSNSVARKVSHNLDWCVRNAFADSDDDNFGTCVLHSTNIPCRNVVQDQRFTSFTLKNSFTESDIKYLQLSLKFKEAITLYPVRNPSLFYYLFHYFVSKYRDDSERSIEKLRNLVYIDKLSNPAFHWPIGNQGGNRPNTRFDISRWDYFNKKRHYLHTDYNNVETLNEAAMLDVNCILNSTVQHIYRTHSRKFSYQLLHNGYKKFDPSRGFDYILDMGLTEMASSKKFLKRFEICKPLGKVEVVPMPYVTENVRINLILPVTVNDYHDAKHFLEQYSITCMEKQEKTLLLIVFLYDSPYPEKGIEDIFVNIKKVALSLSDQYKKKGNKIGWVSIKIPKNNLIQKGSLLLDFAVVDLVSRKFTPDSLILMCQPNMDLKQDFLNRVRMNTILHHQVFSPVPFTAYHPDITVSHSLNFDISKNTGHFDSYYSNVISFYIKDYLVTRKYIEQIVPLVQSDMDISELISSLDTVYSLHNDSQFLNIYKMFVIHSDLNVLRAVEPSLKMFYKEKNCSFLMSNGHVHLYEKCVQSSEVNLGTRSHLAKSILDYEMNYFKANMDTFKENLNFK